MTHQAVAQSVETWLGNWRVVRFESCDWWRRFRCELISWELFDVLIIPLIARLAWAPHCCLQLYLLLGPMQRSCREPCVFSYLFLLLGPMQRSCREPVCFLPFLLLIGAPCSEAAGNPVCFYLFFFFLLLGPMQRSCREPCVFLPFLIIIIIIIIIIPLSSAMGCLWAAHRTVCQKVVKFGRQVKDSCMFNFTQLHVANKHASSATQWVKVSGTFVHITFDPLVRFSKTRYRWISWTMPTSTHPMTS